ncbi:MAG: DUF167 domain-containing protein [Rhodospirillales bacterium]
MFLRVTPKARSQGIGGLAEAADGGIFLKVAVTAPADKGRANAAVVRLLAKEWGLAKSDLEIIQGAVSRTKTLLIRGDGAVLMRSLNGWFEDKDKKDQQ